MRNLLALSAAGVLVFLGIGWYLGWYKISTTPSADGHRQISIDLNTNKIKEDVNKGESKLHDALTNDKNQSSTPAKVTTGIPTSLVPADETSVVFPAINSNPTPPAGTPKLPVPQ